MKNKIIAQMSKQLISNKSDFFKNVNLCYNAKQYKSINSINK